MASLLWYQIYCLDLNFLHSEDTNFVKGLNVNFWNNDFVAREFSQWFRQKLPREVSEKIDTMLSEHMSYEHALTYALCLSKCKSVNSVNQVIQFLQDKENNKINTLKLMDRVRPFLPDEVSLRCTLMLVSILLIPNVVCLGCSCS